MLKRKGELVSPKESLIYMLKGEELLTNSERVASIVTYQNNLMIQLKDQTTGYIDMNKLSDVNSIALHRVKDFDARAELLARPDEWILAYKDSGKWFKIAFCTDRMGLAFAPYNSLETVFASKKTEFYQLNNSIPIEDVPKEELL